MRHTKPPLAPTVHPHIGIALNQVDAMGRGIVRGVMAYIHTHQPWVLDVIEPDTPASATDPWRGQGIIATVARTRNIASLQSHKVPVVNVSSSLEQVPFTSVLIDNSAVGTMAADDFLLLGFRNFGFVGLSNRHFSTLRHNGFAQKLARHKFSCTQIHDANFPDTEQFLAGLQQWLLAAPKPFAVLAANDNLARVVITTAIKTGLTVPNQVAVLGVDDDEMQSVYAPMPISSVQLDFETLGYQAAETLDQLLQRRKPPAQPRLIPPKGIQRRRSSDILAVGDPLVAQAIRYMWDHLEHPLNVEKILDHLPPISRRQFERRFQETLGRSPAEELVRARVERAKNLLVQTNQAMPWIAARCGFGNYKVLAMVFKRITGIAPRDYRKNIRA
jgi:LacI family transcriptional regulator